MTTYYLIGTDGVKIQLPDFETYVNIYNLCKNTGKAYHEELTINTSTIVFD